MKADCIIHSEGTQQRITMTTLVPAFVLALLGDPSPAQVITHIEPVHNVICWTSESRAICFNYVDEGSHLAITLNTQQEN